MVSYFTNGKIGDSAVANAIHNYHDIDLENCIISIMKTMLLWQ